MVAVVEKALDSSSASDVRFRFGLSDIFLLMSGFTEQQQAAYIEARLLHMAYLLARKN
jgi:hypothetical protein